MDPAKILAYAQGIIDEIKRIDTPDQLDRALSAAVAGDVLTLGTSLVYPAPFTLRQSVTLQSETWRAREGQRMAVDEPAPRFLGGFTGLADQHQVRGVEMRHPDRTKGIAVLDGIGGGWGRVRVLGDLTGGARHGITLRGGQLAVADSYVDDVFFTTDDAQAVYTQEMRPGGGATITNSFLRASGQSVMCGGGDPSSEQGVPSNILFEDCELTKRPEWMVWLSKGKYAQQVKCALELKNVVGFTMRRCHLEGAATSAGQGGYLMVFTPRNQDGRAPFSTVRDVTIENCTGRLAGAVASMLGSDDSVGKPSGPLSNLTIRDCAFTDIDPTPYHGESLGRILNFNNGPDRVTIDGVTVEGANLGAHGYFQTQRPPTRLSVSRIKFPAARYGWKLDGNTHPVGVAWPTKPMDALRAYMPDAVLDASVTA